ncbi:hypothetical protein ACLOJK_007468, partial [Asimina triloba]
GDGKAMKLKTSLKLGLTDLLEDIGADGDEDIEGYSACFLALFDRISERDHAFSPTMQDFYS